MPNPQFHVSLPRLFHISGEVLHLLLICLILHSHNNGRSFCKHFRLTFLNVTLTHIRQIYIWDLYAPWFTREPICWLFCLRLTQNIQTSSPLQALRVVQFPNCPLRNGSYASRPYENRIYAHNELYSIKPSALGCWQQKKKKGLRWHVAGKSTWHLQSAWPFFTGWELVSLFSNDISRPESSRAPCCTTFGDPAIPHPTVPKLNCTLALWGCRIINMLPIKTWIA